MTVTVVHNNLPDALVLRMGYLHVWGVTSSVTSVTVTYDGQTEPATLEYDSANQVSPKILELLVKTFFFPIHVAYISSPLKSTQYFFPLYILRFSFRSV